MTPRPGTSVDAGPVAPPTEQARARLAVINAAHDLIHAVDRPAPPSPGDPFESEIDDVARAVDDWRYTTGKIVRWSTEAGVEHSPFAPSPAPPGPAPTVLVFSVVELRAWLARLPDDGQVTIRPGAPSITLGGA